MGRSGQAAPGRIARRGRGALGPRRRGQRAPRPLARVPDRSGSLAARADFHPVAARAHDQRRACSRRCAISRSTSVKSNGRPWRSGSGCPRPEAGRRPTGEPFRSTCWRQRLMRGDKRSASARERTACIRSCCCVRLDGLYSILSGEVREEMLAHMQDCAATADRIAIRRRSLAVELGTRGRGGQQADRRSVAEESDRDGTSSGMAGHRAEELHPPREQIRKAARWAIDTTVSRTPAQILEHYTFYSHVGGALSLWRKTRAADFWRTHEEHSHASSHGVRSNAADQEVPNCPQQSRTSRTRPDRQAHRYFRIYLPGTGMRRQILPDRLNVTRPSSRFESRWSCSSGTTGRMCGLDQMSGAGENRWSCRVRPLHLELVGPSRFYSLGAYRCRICPEFWCTGRAIRRNR